MNSSTKKEKTKKLNWIKMEIVSKAQIQFNYKFFRNR